MSVNWPSQQIFWLMLIVLNCWLIYKSSTTVYEFFFNFVFCHVFSWRELDSLPGVSRNQEGAHALSFNYNNIQHQPNGEGLDTEEEEVCIPLTRFFFLSY